jgi:hypothetical protein
MTEKLRPDELQAFKAAFDMFDKNGDGTISTKVRPIKFDNDGADDLSEWTIYKRSRYIDTYIKVIINLPWRILPICVRIL